MPLTYAKNKKHIYAWREKAENRDKYLAVKRNWQRKSYEWIKIKTIFLNIMLN